MTSKIPSGRAVRLLLFATLLAAVTICEPAARSETPTAVPAPAAAAPSPPADYHPSMGDLMTMAVQPRHTKLALAGRRRNWTYAAY
jgi:hypothetical protein